MNFRDNKNLNIEMLGYTLLMEKIYNTNDNNLLPHLEPIDQKPKTFNEEEYIRDLRSYILEVNQELTLNECINNLRSYILEVNKLIKEAKSQNKTSLTLDYIEFGEYFIHQKYVIDRLTLLGYDIHIRDNTFIRFIDIKW